MADVLASLKDIHLPKAISWWPLAPGWYALILLVLFAVSMLIYFLYQRHQNALAKNKALQRLQQYKKAYEQEHNNPLASAQISELLKQVALVYYPRDEVAGLHGDEWILFLNQKSKGLNFTSLKAMLLESPFKSEEHIDLAPLFRTSRLWIKQRGKPCLN